MDQDCNTVLNKVLATLPGVVAAWRHGSASDVWPELADEIDAGLLISAPMTRTSFDEIVGALRSLHVPGKAVRVDTRIGALPHRRRPHELVVHLSIHDPASFARLSPATLLLLHHTALPLSGQLPDRAPHLEDFAHDAMLLAKALRTWAIPYRRWEWHGDAGSCHRRWRIVTTSADRIKMLRWSASLLGAWCWLGFDCGPGLARVRGALDDGNEASARRLLLDTIRHIA